MDYYVIDVPALYAPAHGGLAPFRPKQLADAFTASVGTQLELARTKSTDVSALPPVASALDSRTINLTGGVLEPRAAVSETDTDSSTEYRQHQLDLAASQRMRLLAAKFANEDESGAVKEIAARLEILDKRMALLSPTVSSEQVAVLDGALSVLERVEKSLLIRRAAIRVS